MKKQYIFILFSLFFFLILDLNASSKYIRVGCEECSNKCYIVSGKYYTEIENEEDYNSITVPSGFFIYDGETKINSSTIYYENESNLLFGCDLNDSSSSKKSNTNNLEVNPSKKLTCEEILNENAIMIVRIGIIALRILAPILLIVLSTFDFMKCIPDKDDEAMFKAWKRLELRALATILLMLTPTLINVLSKLFGIFDSCGIW